ncbi:MAG: leucine-rich repeat domain-containing protein [Saprospiraceae bacterium]|nr:leucine-rich repeat domain-containing protein [Saprospiraceae bacterium]MCB9326902.1 leucine-rich repeat domain-containing protein [Lewinellaceae bacterium]
MHRYPLLFVLQFFLLLTTSRISAQDQAMVVRQSREQGFTCINDQGTVLFTLPPGHDPTVRETNEPFKLSNFYFVDFSGDVLPVGDDLHYYLIDRKGEMVRDLGGDINWVSPFRNGFFRVYEQFENRRNASVIYYIDKHGNPMFDGKKFWEASHFREGSAVVQLDDGQGDWLMIDPTGKTLVNLSQEIPGDIRRINHFDRGIWQLSLKTGNSYSTIYLRPDGAHSQRESDLWPFTDANGRPTYKEEKLKISEKINKRINAMEMLTFPAVYKTDEYAYFIFNDAPKGSKEPFPVLYDHQYEVVTLEPGKGVKKIMPLDFMGKYLLALKITETEEKSLVFYNTENLKPTYEVDNLPYTAKVEGNLLVYYTDNNTFSTGVSKIINLDSGKVIYEPDVSTKVFKSLPEALQYREEVRNLDLENLSEQDLILLKSFPNLEVLKLKKTNIINISEGIFPSFPSLHSLSISYFNDLQNLPEDMRQLTQLQNIFLSDCPNLSGLEDILSDLPSVKNIHTDYRFDKQKQAEIQIKNPQLEFEGLLMVVPDNH